jgi:hypothetical protein
MVELSRLLLLTKGEENVRNTDQRRLKGEMSAGF